jgi:hypothetical protein
MTKYSRASEVIAKNDQAIVVFTRDDKFYFDDLGNGTTGNWVIDPDNLEEIEKVIVYLRKPDEDVNRIYLGNYAGLRHSEEPSRYIIRFSHLKEVGTTDSNWLEFAGGGQNPICYISSI